MLSDTVECSLVESDRFCFLLVIYLQFMLHTTLYIFQFDIITYFTYTTVSLKISEIQLQFDEFTYFPLPNYKVVWKFFFVNFF